MFGELISCVFSFIATAISILTLYYSVLRGARLRIAETERIDFYPKFGSKGKYIGNFIIPIVIINEGTKIGVLSDLYLIFVEPEEYRNHRVRTREELDELPCTVKNQESVVFRIQVDLEVRSEIKYAIKINGKSLGKDIYSSLEFLLTAEDWKKLSHAEKYIKML